MSFSHTKEEIYDPSVGLSPNIFGCGGLITTPHDLATFALGLIKSYSGTKDSILSQEITQKMLTKHIDLNPNILFGRNGMGLGVFMFIRDNTFCFDHTGGNYPGAASVMVANPKTGQGAVIMANNLNAHNRLFHALLYTH